MTRATGEGATARNGLDLALALAFAIALQLASFDPGVVGVNDTLYGFANFQIFYSELLFHGDLARWYPYGTYGLQADYEQVSALAPTSYLVAAAGALFGATDALRLFKLGVLLEQLLFVFGVWRLAVRLFTTRATVRVLAIASAGTTVWYAQLWWDLRIYALLPLVLSFVFAFVERRRPADLWLAGLVGVAWCLGGLPYWLPVWVLVLAIVGAVAVRDWPATSRALLAHGPRDWAALVAFAVAAAGYAWFVLHALEGTVLRAFDRDLLSGKVSLENFRSYGGNVEFAPLARAALFGWPVHLPWGSGADNSVYLGLLPLAGLAVALARERSRPFFALLAGAVALVWLAMGGVFTALVYHLPGFAYYRHVGLTFGIVKVLLLVASGYGLDRIFRARPRLAVSLGWIAIAAIAVEVVAATTGPLDPKPLRDVPAWDLVVLARLACYAALLGASSLFSLPRHALVTIALAADLSLFQWVVHRSRVPRIEDASLLAATGARPPRFDPERRNPPPLRDAPDAEAERESVRALALTEQSGSRELYWYVYQFANLDPCRPEHRTDYAQPGVSALLGMEAALRASFLPVLGCGEPKLRVVADARVVGSRDEARNRLREAAQRGELRPTVIEIATGADAPASPSVAPGEAGRATVRDFSLAEVVVDVEVDAPDGAWLVYADASHPGWRATVDGVAAPVHVANLAWKAVRVPSGRSSVRFWFEHGANHVLGGAVAGFGLLAGVVLLGWLVASLRPRASSA